LEKRGGGLKGGAKAKNVKDQLVWLQSKKEGGKAIITAISEMPNSKRLSPVGPWGGSFGEKRGKKKEERARS